MYMPEPWMMGPPMGGYGGGFPQMSQWGGFSPQYQMQAQQPQQMSGAQRGDARLDRLTGRMSNLQEQWKGADTTQQAALQGRMDTLRGKVKGLRQDRRHGTGLYDASAAPQQGGQPEPAMAPYGYAHSMPAPNGGAGFGGFGGWGMPPWGGYRPQMSTMGAPQGENTGRQQSAPSQGGPAQNPGSGFGQSAAGHPQYGPYEAGNYDTQFGNLVQSNSGQGFLAKSINGGDQQYGYNPAAGWQLATNENMGGFVNPYDYAQQAGARRGQYQQKNGFWQTMPGTGTYA
jgi:hypothetical protein